MHMLLHALTSSSRPFACAVLNSHAPAVIALSRQNLPHLEGSSIEVAMKGGYTVFDTAGAGSEAPLRLVIAATGSEVCIALEAAKKLTAEGGALAGARVQVASFPCLELFEAQPLSYRAGVLPEGVPVLTVEASAVKGWERYGHAWVGMTTFGQSGPYTKVYEKFGITGDAVAARGAALAAYYGPGGKAAPPVPVNAPVF